MKIYAKIILLNDSTSTPIEGKFTNGSISLNGSSSVRRSLSLTVSTDRYDFSASNLLKQEFKIFLGTREDDEQDISWYNMGTYILTDISINTTTANTTLSITAKDYMCKLNGIEGGYFPAMTTLHEDGEYKEQLIYTIIQSIVKIFGGISYNKIIINDIDTTIKQLLSYRGDKTMYFLLDQAGELTGNIIIPLNGEAPASATSQGYNYGENVGYQLVDFVYPQELIMNPGDTVTAALDKIKELLGNYEYYFDLNGNFVFQQIRNYLNTTQTSLLLNELTIDSNYYKSKSVYTFTDDIITNISHTPNLQDIKNDFVIWGVNAAEGDICYHLAIDNKPELEEDYPYDWRERLYELCKDDDSDYSIYQAEMLSYWRTLYNPYLYYGVKDGEIYPTNDTEPGDTWDNVYLNEDVALWRDIWYEKVDNEIYGDWTGWNPDVVLAPTALTYWIDFLDVSDELEKFSIPNIGRRAYIKQMKDVKTLYNADIPDVCLINKDNYSDEELEELKEKLINQGQKYSILDTQKMNYFDNGSLGLAADDAVRDLLYQYTVLNNKVNINHIVVYDLEPNTVVELRSNANVNLNGYYLVESMNIQYNGTMSTTLCKLLERV